MSFILDALKKSEAERQRQAGPTLLEVRITRPRRRYPIWAVIVGALLGINAVVLVVFLLHKPTTVEHLEAATAAAPAPALAPAPAPVARAAAAVATKNVSATVNPNLAASSDGGEQGSAVTPVLSEDTHNPADEEPAVPLSRVQVQRAGPDNYGNLPSISQLGTSVPALQLDLLDYSEHPNERYALINMHRVREGDVLPEGPRVLAITRDGVALNYQGKDFLLRPGGAAQ
jgi:general secretion pathway protein B